MIVSRQNNMSFVLDGDQWSDLEFRKILKETKTYLDEYFHSVTLEINFSEFIITKGTGDYNINARKALSVNSMDYSRYYTVRDIYETAGIVKEQANVKE